MLAIIDYGVGNLFSLTCSFRAIGADVVVTSDKEVISRADRIVLPGVGAFSDASEKIFSSKLADVVIDEAKKGKPLLGICLGMQLLFDRSSEYGEHKGLGLVHGEIRPIKGAVPQNYKVPHVGWNTLKFTSKKSGLFKYIKEGDYVYFVHSFYGADCDESVIANTEYGGLLTAAVQSGNVYGCQFHPEISGNVGLNILRAFCETEGK